MIDKIHSQREQLCVRKQDWHTLVSICPVAIFRTNTKGDCLFVNEQACLLFGLHAGTTQFKNWAESVHPQDRKLIVAAWSKTVRERTPFQEEYRICRTDGKILWVFGQAVEEMITADATERTFIGTFTDISALRHAQTQIQIRKQQLERVERTNTMGEVASSLAHQLNQPLTVIATLAEVCTKKALNIHDMQLQTGLQKILKQAYHAGEIIHRLKNLFSSGKLQKVPTNINDVIRQTLTTVAENIMHVNTKIIKNETLPLILIDPIQIEQVFINIIKNAAEAMENACVIYPILEITTKTQEHDIIVSIQDNGPGIAHDVITEIFEPFFTTKKQGMGMGLAICRTIIEAHAGCLNCRNTKQGGVEFLIKLPLH
jgi:two-component system, LuxR family, sensor kinase FixL